MQLWLLLFSRVLIEFVWWSSSKTGESLKIICSYYSLAGAYLMLFVCCQRSESRASHEIHPADAVA